VRARLLLLVGTIFAGVTRAEPLSMAPLIGASTEYASNPYLLSAGGHSVSDVAVLLNAPTLYDLDSAHFALVPSFRYSDSGSYASLASNYVHLNGSAQYLTDLNSLSLTASFGRDSSLYQNGLTSGGVGVRSDMSAAGIDWQRAITERSQLELDASWNRVLYDQNAETEGLVDYRYISVGSSLSCDLSERNKFKVIAGTGQYQALDGLTESKNLSLQLGLDRKLTELWTLSASAGYARSDNSETFYEGPYLLGTVESEQKGPVYNASLVRQGEAFTFAASASRAYRPSGFQFLSRQNIAELKVSYIYSERWTFGVKGDFTNTAIPDSTGATTSQRYFSGKLSADWHWTPTWVVSLQSTWVNVKYDVPPLSAQSTGISLEISRQFLRIDL
jgi:hypothetical protein